MKSLYIILLTAAVVVTACNSGNNNTEEQQSAATTEQQTGSTKKAELTKVASFKGAQVTGVTISENGRLFANFPRWREGLPFSVVEVMEDGTYYPYPDNTWNSWSGTPKENQFTCIQSVVAHENSLYVLDPASPMFQGVVGNAVLYEFDLATNKLKNKWVFNKQVAPEKSYLNDLRVDDKAGKIYITDSGLGAIVVLDKKSGKAVRLLDKHPSTKSENITLTIEGKQWTMNGSKPQIHSDGIALHKDFLYYHALTGYTLYRIPTGELTNPGTSVGDHVENLGKTPAPDGMIFDKKGNLYMGDLENNAIVYRTPSGKIKTLVQGQEVKWADTFTIDKEGNLYFTTSRLHETSGDISTMDFNIFKVPTAK